jgi:hypothetical protein
VHKFLLFGFVLEGGAATREGLALAVAALVSPVGIVFLAFLKHRLSFLAGGPRVGR